MCVTSAAVRTPFGSFAYRAGPSLTLSNVFAVLAQRGLKVVRSRAERSEALDLQGCSAYCTALLRKAGLARTGI